MYTSFVILSFQETSFNDEYPLLDTYHTIVNNKCNLKKKLRNWLVWMRYICHSAQICYFLLRGLSCLWMGRNLDSKLDRAARADYITTRRQAIIDIQMLMVKVPKFIDLLLWWLLHQFWENVSKPLHKPNLLPAIDHQDMIDFPFTLEGSQLKSTDIVRGLICNVN